MNTQIMNAFRRRQQVFARLTNREQTNQSRDDTLSKFIEFFSNL